MLKKILSICLILVLMLSCLPFFACSSCNDSDDDIDNGEDNKSIIQVTDTSHDFIVNGKTDYVVVVPEKMSEYLIKAREEFVELFRKATDITLPVITDTGLSHSKDNTYISIGETTLYKTSGIVLDKKALTLEGAQITTEDKSIYLLGGSDKGTMYSVYSFMQLTFNFETYYIDCMEIDRGVTDLKLKDYQVKDVPDFEWRGSGFGMHLYQSSDYDESQFMNRMRVSGERGGMFMPVHQEPGNPTSTSKVSTNASIYLPKDGTFYKDNEWGTFKTYWDNYSAYWYSDNGDQFCYTAHGNVDAYNAMIEICAAKICFSLTIYTEEKYPELNVITLTQQDNTAVCTCDACSKAKERHGGANSGALCVFNNKVMELVEKWKNQPENAEFNRDLTLLFFAYDFSRTPPAIQKNGVWVPANEEVLLRDDVGIYLAHGYFENQLPVMDKMNTTARNDFEGWTVITKNAYFWLYGAMYPYYTYLYDTFSFYNAEGYQYFLSKGNKHITNQCKDNSYNVATAWSTLGAYLDAKLQWNCYQDEGKLIDNYFNAMYKDAAGTMKELFMQMREWNAYTCEKYDRYRILSVYGVKPDNSLFWPLSTLQTWLGMIDKAKSEIEYLRETNYDLWATTLEHIQIEEISPLYILVGLYGATITENEKSMYIDHMQSIIDNLDAGRMHTDNSGATMQEWIDSVK